MLEVGDRRAFAQEFGVGSDRDSVDALFAEDFLDLVAGADGDGRFGDDDGPGFDHLGELAHRVEHKSEVGMAVAAPRRGADRDEHRFGAFDASATSLVKVSRP